MTSSTHSHSSFDEFYRDWYPRAVSAAKKRGMPDPESVASDIMIVFLEKGYQKEHDPTMEGAASFDTWVNNIIYLRLSQAHRDSMWEKRRALTTAEALPEHDKTVAYEEPEAEFKMLSMAVFDLINDRYGSELARMWVAVVKQVAEDTVYGSAKKVHYGLMARHLDVAVESINERVTELKNVILHDGDLRELLDVDSWSHAAA